MRASKVELLSFLVVVLGVFEHVGGSTNAFECFALGVVWIAVTGVSAEWLLLTTTVVVTTTAITTYAPWVTPDYTTPTLVFAGITTLLYWGWSGYSGWRWGTARRFARRMRRAWFAPPGSEPRFIMGWLAGALMLSILPFFGSRWAGPVVRTTFALLGLSLFALSARVPYRPPTAGEGWTVALALSWNWCCSKWVDVTYDEDVDQS